MIIGAFIAGSNATTVNVEMKLSFWGCVSIMMALCLSGVFLFMGICCFNSEWGRPILLIALISLLGVVGFYQILFWFEIKATSAILHRVFRVK